MMQTPTQAEATRHDAPDTFRGAVGHFERTRARFYCPTCKTMQTVKSVSGITQAPEHAIYETVLECGHSRNIGINVQRTKAVTKAMEEKRQAKERDELLSDMADARLL